MRLHIVSLAMTTFVSFSSYAGPTGHLEVVSPAAGTSCTGLDWPIAGPVVAPYAPVGRFAGHWGIDIAAEHGSTVRAAATGTVTFSGMVAGNQAVTIDHGGGLKTSYSYLSERVVGRAAVVTRGAVIGTSGPAHGAASLHFSVRVDSVYQNPVEFLGCRPRGPGGALRLVTPLTDATA